MLGPPKLYNIIALKLVLWRKKPTLVLLSNISLKEKAAKLLFFVKLKDRSIELEILG
jgi:hypothetical protein